MFGHDSWRPLTVAALASGALLLPQGVAVAAPPAAPGGVTCEQLGERLGADGLTCVPLRHDGVDGVFVAPRSGAEPDTTPRTAAGAAACPSTGGEPGVNAIANAAAAQLPGDVIDLDQWYLTLPTGAKGDPDTVENPDLARFTNEFFKLNDTRDAVVFSARGDGVTTKNSKYPRSELREMNGAEKAAWTNTSGTHTLDVCEAITKVPTAKPEVVAAQIHDGNDDVLQIRLEGRTLMVQHDDGKAEEVIDPNYELGTPYHVRIVAANSKVEVHYNGEKKADLPLAGEGWYWKVGAYVQSNTDKGDGADAVGEVAVYSLDNVHA